MTVYEFYEFGPWIFSIFAGLGTCVVLRARISRKYPPSDRFFPFFADYIVATLVTLIALLVLAKWFGCREDVFHYGRCLREGWNGLYLLFLIPTYLAVAPAVFVAFYFIWLKEREFSKLSETASKMDATKSQSDN